jgi:putative ABC transport system permease protein
MNDSRYEIVGVMPRAFAFRNRDVDFWVPIHMSPEQAHARTSHYLNVVGRLKPGVSLEAARDDMQAIARTLTAEYPDSNLNIGVTLVPAKEEMLGNTRLELLVLMGAAAAVLLIACANLASLLLSRAAGRRGELAVRAALGASRGRLTRQLVVEGLMLSLAGAAAGLAIVPLAARVLDSLAPIGVAAVSVSTVDLRVLAFTFAIAVATGLLFSAAPALQAARVPLRDALQQHARSAVGAGSRLTRDALVVLQIAAAVVLLVATGLMIRTLANLRALDLGFNPDRLLTMRTTLPRPKYAEGRTRVAFYDRVIDGVKALPGVERVAFASNPPFTAQGNSTYFSIEGVAARPGQLYDALFRGATPDYLRTIGASLVEGRFPDDRDGPDAPRVVVINETLARQFFPGESPLGHRLSFIDRANPWHTIIGVVHDLRERGYEPSAKPAVYFPTAQAPEAWAVPEYLVVRARRDPEALAEPIRRVIASVDPAQPIASVRTMDDILDLEVADRHQQAVLLGAFGALAVVLSSLGLYGLLAYAVAQRSREIGLRVALGAAPRTVVAMVAARGFALTAVGLAVGAAAAIASTRAMRSVLYGITATDGATFAAVLALLGVVACVASVIPAARASRVDPMVVLRDV